MRLLRCPECGLTVHAPESEPLPSEGPTCAMGHAPVKMAVAVSHPGRDGGEDGSAS